MVVRIAIPLALFVSLFLLQIIGFLTANEVAISEKRIALKSKELEQMQVMNKPAKLRAEILATLRKRAKALSEKERFELAGSIVRHSFANDQDPYLILAVVETESSFRRRAVSNKGARGLMQVRPFVAQGLAREMNLGHVKASQLFDLDTNVKIGSYYLAKMIKRYGDLSLALEAYNHGPTRLDRHIRKGAVLKKRYTRKVFRCLDKMKPATDSAV